MLRKQDWAWTLERLAAMPPRMLVVVSSLVLALAALSPAAALGKSRGTDRPLSGKSSSTTTLDLAAGTGTSDGAGHLSHVGKFTFHNDQTSFTLTGPTTFSWIQTATLVAANGDEIFATATGTGAFLTATTSESTLVTTITGGTGRFADASGMLTSKINSEVVAAVGSTVTTDDTETHKGRISY